MHDRFGNDLLPSQSLAHRPRRIVEWTARRWLIVLLLGCAPSVGMADDVERAAAFERSIRPLLIEQCQKCHGSEKQSSGLRLDSREALLQGGEMGPAIVPGNPAASRLMQAVRHEDGLEMPPKGQLNATQIAELAQWIEHGAYWPQETRAAPLHDSARRLHWAFQPITQPEVPNVGQADWVRSPIDAFVLAKLEQAGLHPSPQADRRTLLRRLSYTLTGLPPTYDDMVSFEHDRDPAAYEKWVERYLGSPQHAEHWARHWLDVARYSDTKGYVYAREERVWVHAWSYRDWVVRALQEDLPYDRFLLLQLAADQVPDRRSSDLAAMGFLTLGRRFLGVKRDIIDDRIDVVCRGTMALTVGCARCHDHKYDPIPIDDYYSLYGVFDSCVERLVSLDHATPLDDGFAQELAKRQATLRDYFQAKRAEIGARVRGRVGEYLEAQLHLQDFPEEGFDQVIEPSDLIPAFVRRWRDYLQRNASSDDRVFRLWHAYASLPQESFASAARDVTLQIAQWPDASIHPRVRAAFATPPTSMQEVAQRYGTLLQAIDQQWQQVLAATKSSDQPPQQLADANDEVLRRLLYGPGSLCEVPDEPVVHTEYDFDLGTCMELWRLQGEVDRWLIQAKAELPHALILEDRSVPSRPRIFKRGNPANRGDEVPRQFLSVLTGDGRQPFANGSGRLELAQAIIDPRNPLTARVIVNRVWTHYFGRGLVTTPSDFGTRAAPPSHPELLDWLASQLIENHWSLRQLHRWIALSATFQQSSTGPVDLAERDRLNQVDPDNRLLGRMIPHRLSFEEYSDSLLATSGQIDLKLGGKPTSLLEPPFAARRAIYGLIDRQFLASTLRTFDFANPDLHIPQRSETTVPQQALFMMNHPFAIDRIRKLAATLPYDQGDETAVRVLFQRVYQRDPSESQLRDALALIRDVPTEPPRHDPPGARAWAYGLGGFDDAKQRTTAFSRLPHFAAGAWQGGPTWPDPELGWGRLTATGGHPGNDHQHAAIRRWTAPDAMRVRVTIRCQHEPDVGDGIRLRLVSSQAGLLYAAPVRHQATTWELSSLAVTAGETLDLHVDHAEELNTDQFLSTTEIVEVGGESRTWHSESDFVEPYTPQLTAWELLTQVLLSSNEFLFID